MTNLAKLESLASILVNCQSVQKLAVEGLQFDPTNKPVNKANWTDEEKENVEESKIIAEKNNFFFIICPILLVYRFVCKLKI